MSSHLELKVGPWTGMNVNPKGENTLFSLEERSCEQRVFAPKGQLCPRGQLLSTSHVKHCLWWKPHVKHHLLFKSHVKSHLLRRSLVVSSLLGELWVARSYPARVQALKNVTCGRSDLKNGRADVFGQNGDQQSARGRPLRRRHLFRLKFL
jgi:hypothetical protein